MMQIVGNVSPGTLSPEQFVYWLQGFMEMANPQTLTEEQVKMLKEHLLLVFTKVVPVQQVQVSPKPVFDDVTREILQKLREQQHTGGAGSPVLTPPYTVTCSTHSEKDAKPSVFIC